MTNRLRQDRDFFRDIARIGLPILLQNLIFNSLALVDNVLIGGLGDAAIAALGVANRLGFVFSLLLFGIHSGANMFGAQFWGRRDLAGVRRVLGIALAGGMAASVLFFLVAQLMPATFIRFFIRDEEVVAQGTAFLRIVSWSYLLQSVTSAFAIQSRGVGRTKPPLMASATALCLNTLFGWILIYGKFGLPALGIRGAAIGLLISRMVEMCLLTGIIYGSGLELAVRPQDLKGIDRAFLARFIKPVLPVIANEMLWAVGVSMYMFFYGKMGRSATATSQIMEVVNGIFFAAFIGFGNACGTLVGNSIGAGRDAQARRYANRSVGYGAAGAVVMGGLLVLAAPLFLGFFHVSAEIAQSARMASIVYAVYMPVRVINMVMIVGVCRSGGDTVFAALIDVLSPWLVGIPLAALGVYVLHWPFHLVLALVFAEEAVKAVFGIWRLRSGKWLHNLVRDVPVAVRAATAEEESL